MLEGSITERVVSVHPIDDDSKICGTGVLLNSQYVLTCAHVIEEAVSLPEEQTSQFGEQALLNEPVALTLFVYGQCKVKSPAEVVIYHPPKMQGDNHELADVAILKLPRPLEQPFPPLPCTVSAPSKLVRYFANGFSCKAGRWVEAKYLGKNANWHQLKAVDGDEFAGGLSGGPVIKCESVNGVETETFVGFIVACDKDNPREGYMISVQVLQQHQQIASFLELPYRAPAKLKQNLLHIGKYKLNRIEIKERCLSFFNRDTLIQELNTYLNDSTFLVLAVRAKKRDAIDKLSSRLLYEAPQEQIVHKKQIWTVDLVEENLKNPLDFQRKLNQLALEQFFGNTLRPKVGGKEVETWQEFVSNFAEQYLSGIYSRLVVHYKLPNYALSKRELATLKALLKQWIVLQEKLSVGLHIDIVIMFSVETDQVQSKPGFNFSLSKNKPFDFSAYCQELDRFKKEQPFTFFNGELGLITPGNLGDWASYFRNHFNISEPSLYQELCDMVYREIHKEKQISYSHLVSRVTQSKTYKLFLKPQHTLS